MADRGVPQQPDAGVNVGVGGLTSFDARIEPFGTELLAYCYRMLGSAHDAEDLVQDVYLRAWRAREQYDASRSSLRTWLYRIATNVCLTALATRSRRPLPSGLVAATDPRGPLTHGGEITWLQPLPDPLPYASDPAQVAVDRATLRLAFAGALQLLSARERGAVILRDVLGFSAAESADVLDLSVAAVNSALQRGRSRLRASRADDEGHVPPLAEQRTWVERYMKAFEQADIARIKHLLTDDVVMEMPPMTNWFAGPHNYGAFMEWVFQVGGTDWRLMPVTGNGQPGFAAYRRDGEGYALHTLQIFTVTAAGISRNSVFQDPDIFASFKLPSRLTPRDGQK